MITLEELRQDRFLLEIFEYHASDVVGVGIEYADIECAVRKSAGKVLKTLWPMMSALPGKYTVKHPWDSRESFDHLLPIVCREMFYLGIMAKIKGVGEAVGFTRLEEFGSGYLIGDVGCDGMRNDVQRRLQNTAEGAAFFGRINVLADGFDRMLREQMSMRDVADRASLDERKVYFINACKAVYYAGFLAVEHAAGDNGTHHQ